MGACQYKPAGDGVPCGEPAQRLVKLKSKSSGAEWGFLWVCNACLPAAITYWDGFDDNKGWSYEF